MDPGSSPGVTGEEGDMDPGSSPGPVPSFLRKQSLPWTRSGESMFIGTRRRKATETLTLAVGQTLKDQSVSPVSENFTRAWGSVMVMRSRPETTQPFFSQALMVRLTV